jgi:hypothetical protein
MHDASDTTPSPLAARPLPRETRRHCRNCGRTTRQARVAFDIKLSPLQVWLAPLLAFAEWLGNPWDCQECPRVVPTTSAPEDASPPTETFHGNHREPVGALG